MCVETVNHSRWSRPFLSNVTMSDFGMTDERWGFWKKQNVRTMTTVADPYDLFNGGYFLERATPASKGHVAAFDKYKKRSSYDIPEMPINGWRPEITVYTKRVDVAIEVSRHEEDSRHVRAVLVSRPSLNERVKTIARRDVPKMLEDQGFPFGSLTYLDPAVRYARMSAVEGVARGINNFFIKRMNGLLVPRNRIIQQVRAGKVLNSR